LYEEASQRDHTELALKPSPVGFQREAPCAKLEKCVGNRVDAGRRRGDLITDGGDLTPDAVTDADCSAGAGDRQQCAEQRMNKP
jgi:hypothetical protein